MKGKGEEFTVERKQTERKAAPSKLETNRK